MVSLIGTLVKSDTVSKLIIMSGVSTWSELKDLDKLYGVFYVVWWVARVAAE
jgi:hypothetical protein